MYWGLVKESVVGEDVFGVGWSRVWSGDLRLDARWQIWDFFSIGWAESGGVMPLDLIVGQEPGQLPTARYQSGVLGWSSQQRHLFTVGLRNAQDMLETSILWPSNLWGLWGCWNSWNMSRMLSTMHHIGISTILILSWQLPLKVFHKRHNNSRQSLTDTSTFRFSNSEWASTEHLFAIFSQFRSLLRAGQRRSRWWLTILPLFLSPSPPKLKKCWYQSPSCYSRLSPITRTAKARGFLDVGRMAGRTTDR